MTEDMHEERLHAVEVFGDAFVSLISKTMIAFLSLIGLLY